jgi:hypothetical protein
MPYTMANLDRVESWRIGRMAPFSLDLRAKLRAGWSGLHFLIEGPASTGDGFTIFARAEIVITL